MRQGSNSRVTALNPSVWAGSTLVRDKFNADTFLMLVLGLSSKAAEAARI